MAMCIKCGRMLPDNAKVCPNCGNPVSLHEEKRQSGWRFSNATTPPTVGPVSNQQTRPRTALILAVIGFSVLLVISLVLVAMMGTVPRLTVSTDTLNYGTLHVGSQSSQDLVLSNDGMRNLDWRAVKGNADWLMLDINQGSIPPHGSQTIHVKADAASLLPGHYSATLNFISNGGNLPVSITTIVEAGTPASANGPTIASIEPKVGPTIGGTGVTIRGNGFTNVSFVLFGNTTVDRFNVDNDKQITTVSPAGSGTVHVTVVTSAGTTAVSAQDQFTYVAVPVIASIGPKAGPMFGGTTVIIRGSGFVGASRVLFGTTDARSYTVNSDTQITAISPRGSGTVHIVVMTSVGTTAASEANQFVYAAAPGIASIEPKIGSASGGTKVIIHGSGFAGASRVFFGDVAVNYTVNSDTQITTVSPAGSGVVHVTVMTPGGITAARLQDEFTYIASPRVTSIEPTSGPTSGGTKVVIHGSSFVSVSRVLFGNAAASYTVNSERQITAISPSGSGTVHVTVITPWGTTVASSHNQFTYVVAPPKIASIEPREGVEDGGTQVVIRGSNFVGVNQVLFGNIAVKYTVNNDKQITTVSPAGSGTVYVTVRTASGITAASSQNQFTYILAPRITSVEPREGPISGGTQVIIHGSGFTDVDQVRFGNTSTDLFTVNDSTRITVVSPPGRGTVHMAVITSVGATAASSRDLFTYVAASPKIESIAPREGITTGGTTVSIRGSGFVDVSRVLFGNTPASSYRVNSERQITAVSPAGSGVVHVTVITAADTTVANTQNQFTYVVMPPRIASIKPNSGPAAGGTTVTIRGSGFVGVSQVLFGNTAVDYTVDSGTQITVVSPAGNGTVYVTVITASGATAANEVDQFTYMAALPKITGIDPSSGPAAGGTTVSIRGSGFVNVSRVLFGNTAVDYVVNSDTRLTVVSPGGGGVVHITVTTASGTTAASEASQFTYMVAPPKIASVEPREGAAAGGTTVIIRGSGFTGASRVLFGDTAVNYTVASDTQITVVSPGGDGTVNITVITPTGTTAASDASQFQYIS